MIEEERKNKKYSVHYHLRAPQGLINDPNGLIYFKGQYHVFFQWNPEDTTHANKTWGHAVSDNLIEWTYLEPALKPTDWFDKDGCYSGSAFEKDGKLFLFYTGNVRNDKGDRESYQCLAVSEDGIHFEKKGPLFDHPANYTAHLRDPKVWQQDNTYWMILGAQTLDLKGTALLYRSDDLLDWSFYSEFTDALPDFGYMWECPDVLKLADRDVFVFSPQGIEQKGDKYKNIFQTGYMLGRFHQGTFTPDREEFIEMDRGYEFYAPQSFEDGLGRTLIFGWMGTMPPDLEAAVPTIKDGWIHHLTLPREVTLIDGRLLQQPVEELKALRKQSFDYLEDIYEKDVLTFTTPEQEVVIAWHEAASSFSWTLRCEVTVNYDSSEKRVTVERTNWATGERETRSVTLMDPLKKVQLFIEDSSMELYLNDGREVFSLRYFNEKRTDRWEWKESDWLSNLSQLDVFELKRTLNYK